MSDMPDENGAVILRFPATRRDRPSIEAVTHLAPSRSWVSSLVEEAGIAVHDVAAGMAREFAHQLRTMEAGHGSDEAIVRLRTLMDAHVAHAIDVCREYQAAADRLIVLEARAAREARIVGSLQSSLRRARSEVRGRAIAARAAADAAEGAAGALAAYVRDGLAIGGQVRTVEPEQLPLFAAAG